MKRSVIFGACAVVLFLITAEAVRRYVQTMVPEQPKEEMVRLSPVLVAAHELPVGTALTPEAVRTIRWPADAVPPGAFTDPAKLTGWVTRATVAENEPLLPYKLADSAARGVLPLVIPDGMRAASLRVNEVSGIAGFVTPGSKVDVIAVMDSREQGKGAFTLLQDVEVLAIAQTMDQRETTPTVVNTVTVLVTPAQAERLMLAGSEGTLQLAMRNFKDSEQGNTSGVTVAQLAPGQPAMESVVIPMSEVELIRGNDRAVVRF